jgi:hypothetical protein
LSNISEEELQAMVMPRDVPGAPAPVPVRALTPQSLGGLEIRSVEEQVNSVNMIIFGDSGVGKTRLCGSACLVPEMSPVLFLDVEGGVSSLKYLYPDVSVIRITSFQQLQAVYDALFEGKHPFRTVVVDSLTETQKFGMYDIMARAHAKDSDRDPDLPGIGEWGKNTEQVRRFVRAFRDIPNVNTIFTALRMDDKNKLGVTTTLPSLSGKLAREVSALVDEVLYMYVKNIGGSYERLILAQKTEEIVAKDRSDNLPAVVQAPTMQVLYDYITHRIDREDNTPPNPETVNES